MNRIKYINPRTGQIASLRVNQVSWAARVAGQKIWGGNDRTMRRADAEMLSRGFVRAGRRWMKDPAKRARRLAEITARLSKAAG